MGNNTNKKPVLTYDGENIEISPIEISRAQSLLSRCSGLGVSKARATFSVDTTLMNPTPSGELFGALCVCTNDDHATTLRLLNAFSVSCFHLLNGRTTLSVSVKINMNSLY